MSISLDVQPYCEDCIDIRPCANVLHSDGKACLTVISCEFRDKCARMYRHFENRLKNKMEKVEVCDDE